MLGSQVKLPPPKWQVLNFAWIGYCIFMAGFNAYVATYYSTEQWVDFKIWGYIFPLTFIVGTGFFIAKYAVQTADETPNTPPEKGPEGSWYAQFVITWPRHLLAAIDWNEPPNTI